ncbi:major capsid protein [Vibrio phage VAP7]|uniref:Major capsid protein n=3 Tax=root TaxID=1 RepID=A0A4Y5TWJ4_9CAUD|nr:major capsid protein [Vibrio phage VAP7]AWY10153.1 major capsid protein [Vibrio phage VP-1]QDB73339.1 major capsid protein [Vibrio phage VAP7]UFD98169.1 major capsid protein [Vibrio phage BX-1]
MAANQKLVTEEMRKRWKPVLEKEASEVKGLSNGDIRVRLLESQDEWNVKNLGGRLDESTMPGSLEGHVGKFQPVLISMAKRLGPNNIGMEFFGVQPLAGPDGQIFAMRARKGDGTGSGNIQDRPELFMGEADSGYSGTGTAQAGDPSGFTLNEVNGTGDNTASTAGKGMSTQDAEKLGATGGKAWNRVGVTIQKATVTAKSRGLFADYSHELRQDMMNVHGEDVDSILSDILVTEINAEQTREFIRTMNITAKKATEHGTNGIVNMQSDVSGRWAVEKWKYLLFVLDVEANKISIETRRGKANKVLCAPNVASALTMAGLLDYTTAVSSQANMKVDPTGNVYAGRLANGMDCYVDPYADTINYITLAYKGANQLDAGVFFAPYTPLEMYRANGEDTFAPRMAFKTRYGLVANPFVQIAENQDPNVYVTADGLAANSNPYFRKMAIKNLY